MASQDDIDQQRQRLDAHRATLAVYLRRLARLSEVHARPSSSIASKRADGQPLNSWFRTFNNQDLDNSIERVNLVR